MEKNIKDVNEDIEKIVSGSKFDEIIEDISKWGKILMIKITPSFVIEIKDFMPTGTYGHGYYNFNTQGSSISGHLKASNIEKIVFSSKIHRGMLSHSVSFDDINGEHIFKVFVTRNENREIIKDQFDKFIALRDRL
ncbi:heme utilization cystosolic carrier protein HutX [Aliarcobacter cryaerophilus]|uniref:heme utilization cystosolic carrier protein HutX n=1 Tax=Aliarcobacter cryaerophilus TaxID=28198 RepID=UPI0008259F53|nr:heme utilization cystosolic carrier protein HutX [Aliarcobacter cryaerophilus]